MGYKANQILNNLFQGGFPPPGDGLKASGIDVLVLCAAEHQDASAYPGVQVILAPGDDDPRPERLAKFIGGWKRAAEETAKHVIDGKKVLVTCMQGWNRLGLVMGLTVRILTGMSGADIVKHIQARRDQALCNATFAKYLIDTYPTAR